MHAGRAPGPDSPPTITLGRQHRLKVTAGQNGPAKLVGRYLRVQVRDKSRSVEVKRAVDTWYRRRAHDVLKRYLEKCYAIASRHSVPDPLLAIRSMQRRWGSCSSSGRITLNVNLVQVPVHCIEYVIMHEVCHMRYHNHGPRFYSLLTRCQPDWRKRKEILDRFRIT